MIIVFFLRILVYLVVHDSGQVFFEHLLLSRYPSQSLQGLTMKEDTRPRINRACPPQRHTPLDATVWLVHLVYTSMPTLHSPKRRRHDLGKW